MNWWIFTAAELTLAVGAYMLGDAIGFPGRRHRHPELPPAPSPSETTTPGIPAWHPEADN